MPADNVFTKLRKGDLSVSVVRRVAHTTTNYVKNMKNPVGSLRSATTAASFLGNTTQVAEGVASAGIIYAGAASGFATTAIVAAVAGPQVAVTAAVVGLALLAKSAYSNRDAAHEALAKFVWNLVDYEHPMNPCPTGSLMDDACRAAMTLLEDGKNQIGLTQTKLAASQSEFDTFVMSLDNKYHLFDQAVQQVQFARNRRDPAAERYKQNADQLAKMWLQLYATGKSPGGAAYNYVRRLVHAGNYIQAGEFVALSMRMVYKSGASSNNTDFFAGCQAVNGTRNWFNALSHNLKKREDHCYNWDQWSYL